MGLRYVNKRKTPKERHYEISKFPLGHTLPLRPRSKYPAKKVYQTIVRVDGKIKREGRYRRESRYVTITHRKLLARHELEKYATRAVKRTSERFKVKNAVLISGRKSPQM